VTRPEVRRCCRPTLPAHPVAGCRTASVTAAPCPTAATARRGMRQHATGVTPTAISSSPGAPVEATPGPRRHADAERVTTGLRTRRVSHSPTPDVRRARTNAGSMRPTTGAPPRSGFRAPCRAPDRVRRRLAAANVAREPRTRRGPAPSGAGPLDRSRSLGIASGRGGPVSRDGRRGGARRTGRNRGRGGCSPCGP
jgi:hypothetical protein